MAIFQGQKRDKQVVELRRWSCPCEWAARSLAERFPKWRLPKFCRAPKLAHRIIEWKKVQKMLLSQRLSVDAVAQARTDFEQVPGIALMPWSEIPAPAQ